MVSANRKQLGGARRLVVKVGTAVVTREGGGLALGRLGDLVEQIAALRAKGHQLVLVSSGAVGLGADRLGFETPPATVVDRQACAAAGQGALMGLYDTLLTQVGLRAAQVLLTEDDFLHRHRYTNLHQTLERLLELGAVPIINENDVVSTAELALGRNMVFGDNDRLSALVAASCDADLLVLLTDVDGLFTDHPLEPGAERISEWTPEVGFTIGSRRSRGGRGGMGAKVASAHVGTHAGCAVVVASGLQQATLTRVLAGDDVGTLFPPDSRLDKRRRWLAFATAPAGVLQVNDGARRALTLKGASLLAPGVDAVTGEFEAGSVVSITTPSGREFARGLCGLSSTDTRALAGLPGDGRQRPLVHRNDIVVLSDGEEDE